MADLINPIEMYLKAALELQEIGAPIRRARIAERLDLSGPTVTKAVRRMERDGLVIFSDETKKLTLSPRGFADAVGVLRKHRIAEVFLDQIVGLDWHLLHEEACRLEHVMSDRVTSLMFNLTQRPTHSPYGNPIPPARPSAWVLTAHGKRPQSLKEHAASAGSSPQNSEVTVAWIGEPLQAQPFLLTQLQEANLVPGAKVSLSRRRGSVVVGRSGSEQVLELSRVVSEQLYVHSSSRPAAYLAPGYA